jgi:hypothetical protein
MSKKQETIITFLYDRLPYRMYKVNSAWNDCCIDISAQTLLDIASYVEANRTKLEQEVQEEAEFTQETAEMPKVNQEWRYRTSDLLYRNL